MTTPQSENLEAAVERLTLLQGEADKRVPKISTKNAPLLAADLRAILAALQAAHARAQAAEGAQIAWRQGDPPKDGEVFYGHFWTPCRWHPYSPKSDQARRGMKGRWQAMNEFGGWENCPAPNEWADAEQVRARTTLTSMKGEG